MKILIAEDDELSRNILKAMVAKSGYEPVLAADGLAAYEIMTSPDTPMLALLDWMMPGLDGVEVCRKLREIASNEPPYLILLTSRDSQADIVSGLKAGANDYIVKPYDVEELQVRIGVGRRVVELQSALARRISELQEALAQIKTLQGILPICMYCKKIRDDNQYWRQVEHYVADHSEAEFSHGICPDCYKKHVLPQIENRIGSKKPQL